MGGSEQDLSGVCVTSIDQVETKANQIVNGDRSPEDIKSKDYLGVKRYNITYNKVTQCSGIAHNKDLHNIKTNDCALVTRRSPTDAKLNDCLDVEYNRSGLKSRSYNTRIEQEAVDRRSECARVNVCNGAGSNKDNGPRSRSYIKRTGQRPSRGSVTEYAKVISCDRVTKVEDCLGAAHNNEPQNSSIEKCAFIEDQSNKDAKSPNRSEQDLSGVCVTSIDQVKTKANQIMNGDRRSEDTKSKDNLSVKRNNFTHNKVAQRSGIAHNMDPRNFKDNSRGPVPLTEIEKELVRSRVDHYF